MTANDIRAEVGALALERAAEVEEAAFWPALNRAAEQINRLRPVFASMEIYNRALPVIEESRQAEDYGPGCAIVRTAAACACFYLQIYGKGSLTVSDKDGSLEEISLENDGRTKEIRVVCSRYKKGEKPDIRISLSGEYSGTLLSYAFYGSKYSDDEEDIPDTTLYNRFSLAAMDPDFERAEEILSLEANLFAAGKRLVETEDYILFNHSLLFLPKKNSGRYRVVYRARLPRLNWDNADGELPIRRELHTLVPLLVCYYVWLEDKPEIAQAMFTQYLQAAAEIRNERTVPAYPNVQDVYGW